MSTRLRYVLTHAFPNEGVLYDPSHIEACFKVFEDAWGIKAPTEGTRAERLIAWYRRLKRHAVLMRHNGPGTLKVFREPRYINPKRSKWLQTCIDNGRRVKFNTRNRPDFRVPAAAAPRWADAVVAQARTVRQRLEWNENLPPQPPVEIELDEIP